MRFSGAMYFQAGRLTLGENHNHLKAQTVVDGPENEKPALPGGSRRTGYAVNSNPA
jgi:hypothetical protein